MVLDPQLNVRTVNPAFCEQFQVERADIENRSFMELGDGVWNVPELRKRLDQILPGDRLEGLQLELDFPTVGRKTVYLQGWRTRGSDVRPAAILLTLKDS